jgi:hypothetical protein
VVRCENDEARCETWAREGECAKNPNYMLNHCKKACKNCGVISRGDFKGKSCVRGPHRR